MEDITSILFGCDNMERIKFYTNCQVVGGKIGYRGISGCNRKIEKYDYSPTLFYICKKESKFHTVYGQPLCPTKYDDIWEARKAIKQYKDVENFKIYGNRAFQYTYLADEFPDDVKFDQNKIQIAMLDIEVFADDGFPEPTLAAKEITAITMKYCGVFHVFGCGEFKSNEPNIAYHKCENESELLTEFLKVWRRDYPDIVCGWNSDQFDLPYIINRITNVLGRDIALTLSPWKEFTEKTINIKTDILKVESISGISSLDYMLLYKKFEANKKESYSLSNIAQVELGKDKVDYGEYGNLNNLFKENYQKFIEYNIVDVKLVDLLEDKLKYIQQTLHMAYMAKINYDDVMSQVRLWDNLIFNYLKKKHLVIPPKSNEEKDAKFRGAYVKELQIGLHKWIACFDVTSLYPNIMRLINISPECLTGEHYSFSVEQILDEPKKYIDILNEKDITLAGNGHTFSREKKGFLPDIVSTIFNDRKMYKKKMLKAKEELERIKTEINRRGMLHEKD